jgi:hypothetical protein
MMMGKINFLVPFIVLLTLASATGQIRLSFSMGYGNYNMGDLKDVQKIVNQIGTVELKSLTSFPPYYQFDGGVHYDFKDGFFTGLLVGYGSTGSHSNYSDYSGSVTADQLINYKSLTLSCGLTSKSDKAWQFSFDLKPGIYFNRLTIILNQKIGTQESEENINFKSYNLAVQPTASIRRSFGSFGILAFVGYSINVKGGKLALEDDKNAYLVNNSNDPAIANWSGFRVGIGTTFSLNFKRTRSE